MQINYVCYMSDSKTMPDEYIRHGDDMFDPDIGTMSRDTTTTCNNGVGHCYTTITYDSPFSLDIPDPVFPNLYRKFWTSKRVLKDYKHVLSDYVNRCLRRLTGIRKHGIRCEFF